MARLLSQFKRVQSAISWQWIFVKIQ